MRWRARLAGLATIAALAAPSGGLAATVTLSGTDLGYTAGPGETNSVTVTAAAGSVQLTDTGAAIIVAGGAIGPCGIAGATVTCPTSLVQSLTVDVADGDDAVTIATALGTTLAGGDGSDSLRGGDGDDLLIGGLGADQMSGGGGEDGIRYFGLDPVSVTLDGVANDGPPGDGDNAAADIENITGGGGNDVLVGSPLGNALNGGAGNDTISGGGGNDNVIGGVGADVLSGGPGQDRVRYSERLAPLSITLDGIANDGETGEGDLVSDDVEDILGGASNDVIVGNSAPNELFGGGGDDILTGLAGNDGLAGGDGADRLVGSGGDDGLTPGPGRDVLIGGTGLDRANYNERVAPLTITLDRLANDGEDGESDNVEPDVETLIGGAGDDTISGGPTDNALIGGAGNDLLTGLGGNDELVGDDGDDRLIAGIGNDFLVGGGGDDTLLGEAGEDSLAGGEGADSLSGGADVDRGRYTERQESVNVTIDGVANDGAPGERDNVRTDIEDLSGGAGPDTLVGSAGPNKISGGAGNDVIQGLGGNDGLVGDAGDDVLRGGAADDLMLGGTGSDVFDGGGGVDRASFEDHLVGISVTLDGQRNDGEPGELDDVRSGVEHLTGGPGNDLLSGDKKSNVVDGGLGNDVLIGRQGPDTLFGGDGNDRLLTGTGDDSLIGGRGNDYLDGGTGRDELEGDPGSDELIGGLGIDVLDGGAGNDLLRARDNQVDNVMCGPGADRTILDRGRVVDLVDRACEPRLRRP